MANKKFNILVLGANGMVGHSVFNYLSLKFPNYVFGTYKNKPQNNQYKFQFTRSSKDLENIISKIENLAFVINCIGELKNGNPKKMSVNYALPRLLEKLAEKNDFFLIHISTDAVFPELSGEVNEKSTPRAENLYAKTKLKGETKSEKAITVRTSFLGFDKNKKGLLEWIRINKSKKIDGFENQIWSGCTSLQFAKFCEFLINGNNFKKIRQKSNIIHFVPLGPVSKYKILVSVVKILKLRVKVNKLNSDRKITRTLKSIYLPKKFFENFNDDVDLSILEMYKFENI